MCCCWSGCRTRSGLGHPVLAVVRGSAVNQDGASNGLTAPNGPSQQRLIRRTMNNAGLTAADVDAVEAHGTGTTLGDPIEAQAIIATYGQGRSEDRPLWLGSLKSNIGHAQAAAGVASVIKTVMALQKGVLPKTLHVDEPTPQVDWSAGAVELLTQEREWPEVGRPRRAAVSSFGVSGTNAHVILEQASEASAQAVPVVEAPGGLVPLVVSGRGKAALRAQAQRLLSFLGQRPEQDLGEFGLGLAAGRAGLRDRAVVLAADRDEALAGLAAVARGESAASVHSGSVSPGRVGVLFSGQGSQRLGMGRGLYEAFPVYREAFDAVCAALDAELKAGSVRDVVFGEDAGALERTVFAQAGLFAVETALFRLVESWGVTPDVVGGHSIGEVTAAHVAGVLSLEDAAKLVAARGRLMDALPEGGAMVTVAASEEEVRPLLEPGVEIAAVNGPSSVVLSGDEYPVSKVAGELTERGRRTKRLAVSHAFHSARMEPMLAEFERIVQGLSFADPAIPLVSNVTGELADTQVLRSPAYWVRHVRSMVRFADGVRALGVYGVNTFLELGPDGTLSAMGRECLDDVAVAFVPALRREGDEPRALMTALARLHISGRPVDFRALFGAAAPLSLVSELPTYAFQQDKYWLVGAGRSAVGDVVSAGLTGVGHPLLGAVTEVPESGEVLFSSRLALMSHPWLADHEVAGTVLLPGAAFVDLALCAGRHVGLPALRELTIAASLPLPAGGAVEIQVSVQARDERGRRAFGIHSRPEPAAPADPWTTHATGELTAETGAAGPGGGTAWPPPGAEPLPIEDLYRRLDEEGYTYGPHFQALTAAWRDPASGTVYGEVRPPAALDTAGHTVHPAFLDAALHPLMLAGGAAGGEPGNPVHVPFAWTGVVVPADDPHPADGTAALVTLSAEDGGPVAIRITAEDGTPTLTVDGLVSRPLDPAALATGRRHDALFHLEWDPVPLPDAPTGGRCTVVTGHSPALAAGLLDVLRELGLPCDSVEDLDDLGLPRLRK